MKKNINYAKTLVVLNQKFMHWWGFISDAHLTQLKHRNFGFDSLNDPKNNNNNIRCTSQREAKLYGSRVNMYGTLNDNSEWIFHVLYLQILYHKNLDGSRPPSTSFIHIFLQYVSGVGGATYCTKKNQLSRWHIAYQLSKFITKIVYICNRSSWVQQHQ